MKLAKKRIATFSEGNLKNIKIYLTEEYQTIAYPNGDTDVQMINDIKNNGPKGKTIFDIGTFIGASCLVFAELVGPAGKIIGFEPNPFNRKRITENFALNPELRKRITVSPFALSDKEGQMTMTLSSQIDNGYSSTSRLNQSHPTLHNDQLPKGFEEVTVEVTTLDRFVAENKIVPDILKVDIEGAEYDFLLGARSTVQKYKPVLYIELHSEFCAVRCVEFLHSLKYGITILYEEEDNRIMIKAEFNKQREAISCDLAITAQRNLDASLNMIKIAEKVLDDEVKKNKAFEVEIQTLGKEIEDLKAQILPMRKENINLKEENYALRNALSSYENSNSWKITKPLRSIKNILHKK